MKHLLPPFIVLFIISILAIDTADAQRYRRWNRYKKEFGISLGGTVLLGDLGGSNLPRGINFKNSSYNFGGYFKYRFHERFAAKGTFNMGKLASSDGNSPDGYLEERGISRGLNTKTKYTEIGGQIEYYLFPEKIGSRYKVRGVKGYGQSSFAMYILAGVGVNIFTPQGRNPADGEYINLRNLKTEGQGLPGGPASYGSATLVFPLGLGVKYNFNREWGVQLEGSWRVTTSDYLDDVGEFYYDSDKLAAEYGEQSRIMAEKGHGKAAMGERRGGDSKDSYLTGTITLTYRIKSKARSRVRL